MSQHYFLGRVLVLVHTSCQDPLRCASLTPFQKCFLYQDGQLIESVLMPYEDGRYTACISSQAGCAQGCVFCATGQMGFSRQLTADEILEQVSRFSAELAKENDGTTTGGRHKRLSNIVFMGMGKIFFCFGLCRVLGSRQARPWRLSERIRCRACVHSSSKVFLIYTHFRPHLFRFDSTLNAARR